MSSSEGLGSSGKYGSASIPNRTSCSSCTLRNVKLEGTGCAVTSCIPRIFVRFAYSLLRRSPSLPAIPYKDPSTRGLSYTQPPLFGIWGRASWPNGHLDHRAAAARAREH